MRASIRSSVILGALIAALVCAAPALAAPVIDPERNSTAVTGWWWYHGVSEATLSGVVSTNGARIIDLEVESTAPYTFSAAFVKNTGTYARTWWWYYGLTSSQVAQRISQNNARLIDIERYTVGGQRRFAVVMVRNTGVAAKAWWYYYDVSASTLASKLSTNNARLIDLESYTVSGATRFSAVMIRNTGVDAKAWWWYYNVSASFVSNKLSVNKARLIDIERRSNGNFNVVMQRRGSEYWWWYYDATAASVAKLVSQNGARIVDIEPYIKNGTKRFAIVLLNDLNSESSRLREIMRTGLSGGSYGVYVKKVGGSAPVALQSNTIFEPASSMKVVHHLFTMQRIMNGTGGDSLGVVVQLLVQARVIRRTRTSARIRPGNRWSASRTRVTTTIQDGLTRMMQNSDNRTTRGFHAPVRASGAERVRGLARDDEHRAAADHRLRVPERPAERPDAGRRREALRERRQRVVAERLLPHDLLEHHARRRRHRVVRPRADREAGGRRSSASRRRRRTRSSPSWRPARRAAATTSACRAATRTRTSARRPGASRSRPRCAERRCS